MNKTLKIKRWASTGAAFTPEKMGLQFSAHTYLLLLLEKEKKRFWNCNVMSLSRFLIYVRFVGKEKGTTPNVLSFTNINRF